MTAPPHFVTGVSSQILEALASYRYVTIAQLLRLGVSPKGSYDHVAERLRDLELRRLVQRQRFGVDPNMGKMPDVFWLTRLGAEYLTDTPDPSTGRRPQGRADIWHRIAVVDIHLALRTWAAAAGWSVEWVKVYFDVGRDRRSATAVTLDNGEPYIPDLVALLTTPAGRPRLLAIEVYRGGWKGDLAHFRRQLPKLMAASVAGCCWPTRAAFRRLGSKCAKQRYETQPRSLPTSMREPHYPDVPRSGTVETRVVLPVIGSRWTADG